MSHFYALHNARGNVLFENDKFYLLNITSSAADSLDLDTLRVLAPIQSYSGSGSFAPRFPHYLVIGKTSGGFILNNDDIAAIDDEAVINADPDLQRVLLTIKSLKGRAETLDPRPFFTTGYYEGALIRFENGAIEGNGEWTLGVQGQTFNFTYKPARQRDTVGVFFLNEFESIYLPVADDANFSEMVKKVQKRAALDGRIASNYLVIPSSETHRTRVQIKDISNMKTEDMLTFFSHHKKSGTKVETLSGCLQSLTKRHVRNLEESKDDVALIQVSTHGITDSPIEIPPIDWVLCRAAYLKTEYAEVLDDRHQNIFVRVVDQPVDDFAGVLYTTWEQSKRSIQLAFFDPQALHNIFASVRNSEVEIETVDNPF